MAAGPRGQLGLVRREAWVGQDLYWPQLLSLQGGVGVRHSGDAPGGAGVGGSGGWKVSTAPPGLRGEAQLCSKHHLANPPL